MPATPGAPMMVHELRGIKNWPFYHQLDKHGRMSSNVTFNVPKGRVAHLNANREFEMGVEDTQMAIFLLHDSNDFDVSNPGYADANNPGLFMHQAIMRSVNGGIVATAGVELGSTEFDVSRDYAPNDVLTATVANSNSTTGGRLTNDCEQYTDAVCGVVSDGAYTNEHGVRMLNFWSVYLPAEAA